MSASFDKAKDAFRAIIDADLTASFAACVHCGLCAQACLFCTETGNPEFAPIHKLRPLRRFWEEEFTLSGRLRHWLGWEEAVSEEELLTWSERVYDACTLCGRCSLACPAGIDLTALVRKMREGMARVGAAPASLMEATRRAVIQGSPMGVQWETMQVQIRHQEEKTGIAIPVDRQGAEYLLLLSSMEIVHFPEILGAMARIFQRARVTWTLSHLAFEATNSGIQVGVSDIAREIVRKVVVAAEELGIGTVVSPECGHAYTALRWEGPNLMGHPFVFQVRHVLEVLSRLQEEGRIVLRREREDPRSVTYHDPCQIARRGGILEEPRRLIRAIASDFREMAENRQYNWCCGGGGGVSAIDRAEGLRGRVFGKKAEQIRQTGAQVVLTSCSNCRIMIEDGVELHHVPVEVAGLVEWVADHLEEEP